jgi:hypothetical protein
MKKGKIVSQLLTVVVKVENKLYTYSEEKESTMTRKQFLQWAVEEAEIRHYEIG